MISDIALELKKLHVLSGAEYSRQVERIAKSKVFHPLENEEDKGGLSLLKAFTENIGACIDNQLSKLPEGYDIKFMLWHQGESDRSQADSYHDNLKAVVDYVRTYLVNKTGQQKYARLPFICGTFSKASKQGSPKVAAALYQLQQEDANFHVVDVSDATLGRDQIHFDAAGAELLGKRMFDKLSKLGLCVPMTSALTTSLSQ